MRTAWLIAAKDLRLRIRDRSAFVLGILAPLGLAFIFNLVLGDIVEGEFVPVYAVADLDGGPISSSLVSTFRDVESQGVIGLAGDPSSREEAQALVDEGTVSAAIVIPEGFSDRVQSGEEARITVIGDPDNPTSIEIARSIAEGFAAEIEAVQLSVATVLGTSSDLSSPEVQQLAGEAAGVPNPIDVGRVEAARRELDLATFFAASMSVFFLFFTVAFGVSGLLEERQQGTITRLLAAPIRGSQVIVGKTLVSFIVGLVSMAVLIVASTLLLGAEWGNPVGVAVLVLAGVLAATGLMTLVAAYSKTPEQAGNLQAILAVGLGMLGGIFFPASLGTGVLANLAYISPHRWFLTGLSDLAGGGAISVIWPSVLGLLGFAAVGWGLSAFRFRKGLAA